MVAYSVSLSRGVACGLASGVGGIGVDRGVGVRRGLVVGGGSGRGRGVGGGEMSTSALMLCAMKGVLYPWSEFRLPMSLGG